VAILEPSSTLPVFGDTDVTILATRLQKLLFVRCERKFRSFDGQQSPTTEDAMKEGREISLTDAAFELGLRYHRALNLVLCGDLRGRKVEGRWKVDAASVARVKTERQALRESPQAA
jgi:hypothetical protein